MRQSAPEPASRRTAGTRRRLGRFVPILVLVLFGLFILKQEVPAVNRWFQQLTAPERHAAAEACRRAALDAAEHPGYARVRKDGEVHETRDGFYVEGVQIGSMDDQGSEAVFRYNCYVDRQGNLVNTNREDAMRR